MFIDISNYRELVVYCMLHSDSCSKLLPRGVLFNSLHILGRSSISAPAVCVTWRSRRARLVTEAAQTQCGDVRWFTSPCLLSQLRLLPHKLLWSLLPFASSSSKVVLRPLHPPHFLQTFLFSTSSFPVACLPRKVQDAVSSRLTGALWLISSAGLQLRFLRTVW